MDRTGTGRGACVKIDASDKMRLLHGGHPSEVMAEYGIRAVSICKLLPVTNLQVAEHPRNELLWSRLQVLDICIP